MPRASDTTRSPASVVNVMGGSRHRSGCRGAGSSSHGDGTGRVEPVVGDCLYGRSMPLQNRVTPAGELIATSARGIFLGNRGILHDEYRQIRKSPTTTMWLICQLEFNGRKQEVMGSGRYTQLFFLDEAVALAAGHRPCGECRRTFYRAYIDTANVGNDTPIDGAKELDRQLNASRKSPLVTAAFGALPDGVFVQSGENDFRLMWDGSLHRWTPERYVDPIAIADADVTEVRVMTPAFSVDALRHGYPVSVLPVGHGTGATWRRQR